VEVKPPSDGDHSEILVSLLREFASKDRTWNLFPYAGLCTEASLAGRYLPDAILVRRGHRLGRGHWASPDIVSAVVEIVSRASGKDHRGHDAKRTGCASVGIPVHILIDRDDNTITVFSEPKDGHYQLVASYPWGTTVQLPAPVDVALNTERLKNYMARNTEP
jgi:Uma2 family endonuclease